jgi:hypothetical protein
MQALRVEGRWFIDEQGKKTVVRGVNIASLEWTSSGENMTRSLGVAVDDWKANLVRIPLCQDRWFGKTADQQDGGYAYRSIVAELVRLADQRSCYILLELHWNDAGKWGQFIGQHKMPDSNSVAFWEAIAQVYANHPAVWFGLYNEPHDIAWSVWRDGGTVTEDWEQNGSREKLTYTAMGFQALADTVRAAGATRNILVVGGLDWGYDLSGVSAGFGLRGTNIAYDTHPYPWKNTNWNGKWADVGRQTAIIVGEWGGDFREGHRTYGNAMAEFLRQNAFSWTAWCFHPSAGPCLIQDWNYTPTGFGSLVKNELAVPVVVE